MNIQELLKKAEGAAPPAKRKSALEPVIDRLREQGFSVQAACNWLVEQGAITEGQAASLKVVIYRREKKARVRAKEGAAI